MNTNFKIGDRVYLKYNRTNLVVPFFKKTVSAMYQDPLSTYPYNNISTYEFKNHTPYQISDIQDNRLVFSLESSKISVDKNFFIDAFDYDLEKYVK